MRKLSDEVTETTFDGYLTSEALIGAGEEYWRLVGENAAPYGVLDGTTVTGFERSLPEVASVALRRFKERGGREYVVITTSSALRMMGAAMAASSQVPFRFFTTRAEAFDHLRALGVWQ